MQLCVKRKQTLTYTVLSTVDMALRTAYMMVGKTGTTKKKTSSNWKQENEVFGAIQFLSMIIFITVINTWLIDRLVGWCSFNARVFDFVEERTRFFHNKSHAKDKFNRSDRCLKHTYYPWITERRGNPIAMTCISIQCQDLAFTNMFLYLPFYSQEPIELLNLVHVCHNCIFV